LAAGFTPKRFSSALFCALCGESFSLKPKTSRRTDNQPSSALSFEARPRELSINWQDTAASATRRSPTKA